MDPEAPRALGDLEDPEPERRAPVPKRSLEEFLEEFEARLRDNPGQAATSATAALEGRAGGAWRTPVEGAESSNRRLPRRVPGRRVPEETPPAVGAAAVEPPVADALVVEAPALEATIPETTAVETPAPSADATPTEAAAVAATSKRRNRHRRHHRHR